jgi:hypothetical protein
MPRPTPWISHGAPVDGADVEDRDGGVLLFATLSDSSRVA